MFNLQQQLISSSSPLLFWSRVKWIQFLYQAFYQFIFFFSLRQSSNCQNMTKSSLALALITITIPGMIQNQYVWSYNLILPHHIYRPGVRVTMLLWPLRPQLCRGCGDLWRGRGLLLLQDRVQGGGCAEDGHVASLRVPHPGQVGLELRVALVSRGVGRGRRGRNGGVHLLLQGGALQWKHLPSA